MGRKLAATVFVGDRAYGPGTDVPDDVAAQITNPAAWADDEPTVGARAEDVRPSAGKAAKAPARKAEDASPTTTSQD